MNEYIHILYSRLDTIVLTSGSIEAGGAVVGSIIVVEMGGCYI